jgi:hypothetical protein
LAVVLSVLITLQLLITPFTFGRGIVCPYHTTTSDYALYANELIARLLQDQDPHFELFEIYKQFINQLPKLGRIPQPKVKGVIRSGSVIRTDNTTAKSKRRNQKL